MRVVVVVVVAVVRTHPSPSVGAQPCARGTRFVLIQKRRPSWGSLPRSRLSRSQTNHAPRGGCNDDGTWAPPMRCRLAWRQRHHQRHILTTASLPSRWVEVSSCSTPTSSSAAVAVATVSVVAVVLWLQRQPHRVIIRCEQRHPSRQQLIHAELLLTPAQPQPNQRRPASCALARASAGVLRGGSRRPRARCRRARERRRG